VKPKCRRPHLRGQNERNRSRISNQDLGLAQPDTVSMGGIRGIGGNTSTVFFGRRIVKQGKRLPGWMRKFGWISFLVLVFAMWAVAQEASPAPSQADAMASAIRELQEQVKELRTAVADVRSEAAQYRAETQELKRQLDASRAQLKPPAQPENAYGSVAASPATSEEGAPSVPETVHSGSLAERVAALEETSQLLNGKVDEQYQTKVESASKYRLRLSGIVLLNLFSNRGVTDNQDFPSYVTQPTPFDPNGSFGATMRQSEIGLEVFGPRLAGAKTMGEVRLDFAGGFPNTGNGVTFGLVRLRTASMRLDWDHTSIVAGQDNLFLSPLAPTSFASLAVPAFSYAGDLWGWIPQVRVEHRFDLSQGQKITLQAGIIDNLTGEPPYVAPDSSPQTGERSGQPGYGVRTAWTANVFGQPMTLGVAGYYGRQDWAFNRHIDAWGGMTDWDVPLASHFTWSGELYRGRAIGGFGGGIGRSVLFDGNPTVPYTQVEGLDSVGGWSQLKYKATAKLEFNGAFGMDSPFAGDVRGYSAGQGYLGTLVQNRGALVNFIYRPRSNLVFSTEYRHLRTAEIDSGSHTAEQVNMIMGILF